MENYIGRMAGEVMELGLHPQKLEGGLPSPTSLLLGVLVTLLPKVLILSTTVP